MINEGKDFTLRLYTNEDSFQWRIQGGALGMRSPPLGTLSFIFMQFSAKNRLVPSLWGRLPSLGNFGSTTGFLQIGKMYAFCNN